MNRILACLLAGLFTLLLPESLVAQQFRVYTRVTALPEDAADNAPKSEVLLRSLTIFHAGRVFDLLHGMGEVTVFEPAHERFLVLNFNRKIATTVTLPEIERLLSTATDDARNFARRMSERSDPASAKSLEPLLFQLNPQLAEKYDAQQSLLQLTSDRFRYDVTTGAPPDVATATAYLEYVDWAARLNYVLHPNRVLPEARLRLNASLRSHEVLPLKVKRRVAFEGTETLLAEHVYTWQLSDQDREYINHWDQKIRGDELEWMTFRDYQWAVYDKKTAEAR